MTAWGLLSTARINHPVLAGARLSDHVDVIAVASRDPARAEAYARQYNIEQAYGSYDALLEDPAVEAVYIALPNSMHMEWTLRALAARKHVLCEKPFSRRAFEVERSGVDVCFAATLRFPGDVVAHFDCGFVIPYRDELEVVGDQASLHVDDPWHIHAPGIELRREREPGKIEAEWIQVDRQTPTSSSSRT